MGKIDFQNVGKDIYELLKYPRRRSFKQRARKQTVELKPDKLYTPYLTAEMAKLAALDATRHGLGHANIRVSPTLAES